MNEHVTRLPAALPDARNTVAAGVDKATYREAMSRLAATVNIVTTDGPAGRAGFTASAVCSVTDEPPTLLVCLNKSASVAEAFEINQALCVNAVTPSHQDLAVLFGGKTPSEERFAAASWHSMSSGAPILDDVAVAFDCRIESSVEVGTHKVLFCRVEAVELADRSAALLYFNRRFHGLVDGVATDHRRGGLKGV